MPDPSLTLIIPCHNEETRLDTEGLPGLGQRPSVPTPAIR